MSKIRHPVAHIHMCHIDARSSPYFKAYINIKQIWASLLPNAIGWLVASPVGSPLSDVYARGGMELIEFSDLAIS